jgi:hypothetical protein
MQSTAERLAESGDALRRLLVAVDHMVEDRVLDRQLVIT